MDTGLTRKIYDMASQPGFRDNWTLRSNLESGMNVLRDSLSKVGAFDNGSLEGDFSLMQSLGQRNLTS